MIRIIAVTENRGKATVLAEQLRAVNVNLGRQRYKLIKRKKLDKIIFAYIDTEYAP